MDISTSFNMMAASFPLLSGLSGRSVAVRQPTDTNYVVANGYQGTQADRAIGIPMPVYMHNVLPTSEGFRSVAFKEVCPPRSATKDFDKAFILQQDQEDRYVYTPAQGQNYILTDGTAGVKLPFVGPKRAGEVTRAYVQGRTFICYARQGIYEFDGTNFNKIELTGLDSEQIEGICSGANYLIAYTKRVIHWSSNMNPTEFTPTLSTGAGAESIQEVRGAIVACFTIAGGFVVYSTQNAVFAGFTNNSQYPWRYQEIKGSSGIRRLEHVASDSNYEFHFAWTTVGLTRVSVGGAESTQFAPEISEFLAAKVIEDIAPNGWGTIGFVNESGNTSMTTQSQAEYPLGPGLLVSTQLAYEIAVKLTAIGSRYFILSYGKTEDSLTHALVYDMALRRWGKLKIPHVDCFSYVKAPGAVAEEAMSTVAFLQADGAIKTVDFSHNAKASDAVLIFGKIQNNRQRCVDLQVIEAENIRPNEGKIFVLSSFDGKTWMPPVAAYQEIASGYATRWLCRQEALNHCLLIEGTFELNTLIVHFNLAGKI